MKKVYYILCLLILTIVVIESPLFSSDAADVNVEAIASETIEPIDFTIEVSWYELYIYAEDSEALIKDFEKQLTENNLKFEKTVKENNNNVFQYTFTNMDLDNAFSIYEQANNIIKAKNENAVINLSARGSVNDNFENIKVAKAIYNELEFTPNNILNGDNFYEADGAGYFGIQSQEMQIVVRKSQNNDFSEFIIGIPSVLNEY